MKDATRKGRPPRREPESGERVPLGLRVTAELKKRLDQAAVDSGRSQSQEAELRLDRSFSDGDLVYHRDELQHGRDVVGFLMLAERAMTRTGNMVAATYGKGREGWLNDPYAYDQAVKAFLEIVETLRPAGRILEPGEVVDVVRRDTQGKEIVSRYKIDGTEAGLFVADLLSDVAGDAPGWPRSEWGAAVSARLGQVAKRIPPFKPVKQKGAKS